MKQNRVIFYLPLGLFVATALFGWSTLAASNQVWQTARVLSVKKVLHTPQYVFSGYPQIHYYLLYISLRTSDTTYCAEYETPLLDEINDVLASDGKDVAVMVKGKNATMDVPQRHKLKARFVTTEHCL